MISSMISGEYMIQKLVPNRKSRFDCTSHDLLCLFGRFYNKALDQFNSRIEVTLPGLYKHTLHWARTKIENC